MPEQEYWNIPKFSDDLLTTQGTNLTVFVDNVDDSLFWGLGSSDVTAFVGVLIASLALGVSIWQWFSARKQNILMVTPHIVLTKATRAKNRTIQVSIKNNGIGPGVINKCMLKVSGKELILDKVCGEDLSCFFTGATNIEVSLISCPYFLSPSTPSHDLIVVTLVESDEFKNNKLSELLDSYLDLIEVDLEYSDIYGNKIKVGWN